MKVLQLKQFDESFSLVYPAFVNSLQDKQEFSGGDNLEVECISDLEHFYARSLFFIKNKKFFQEFIKKFDEGLANATGPLPGLVIEEKFFESMKNEVGIIQKLQASIPWMATVADVNLCMSFFSKKFYEIKFGNPNDMVDGRQMGTAQLHPTAWVAQGVFVGENVKIHRGAKIHSGVVIMSHSEIGENSEIFPNTTIYHNVKIGQRVRIHSQAVIGADGFGYNFHQGVHHKVWHMGGVEIGSDVEIGALTSIDSGTFSPTKIGNGSKIDNQVQIGHNCKIGRGVILCGQVGLAGSVTIGDFTVLGGKAAVGNGVKIGQAVQVAGNAGVISDIDDKAVVGGFPAQEIKSWMKGVALLKALNNERKVQLASKS